MDLNKVVSLVQTRLRRMSKRQWRIAGVVAFVVFLLIADLAYHFICFESTDDAFLQGHVHIISPEISGSVQKVLVKENQFVRAGDTLVALDARDYEAQVKIAQANYSKAHKDVGRFSAYLKDLGPADKPVFDRYQADALISDAKLTKAQLQLEDATIKAPADGKIGKRAVEVGDEVQPGQALMALVEPNPWIEANFKEGQVARIRPGQTVEVEIDAISGKTFTGHVDSIAPGSGSLFSLLPPDNATGNFTKIVQRIPVKIVLDPSSVKGYEDRLIPGMSAEVTVKVE